MKKARVAPEKQDYSLLSAFYFKGGVRRTQMRQYLRGEKFGRLEVIGETKHRTRQGSIKWMCQCDCGKQIIVDTSSLKNGNTQSCGCLRLDRLRKKITTHGMSDTPTYNSWCGMLARCNNSKNPRYEDYGNRGIKVCERWSSFDNFLKDMGERPKGKTIDRIDNNLGYGLNNCKWATLSEQQRNTRAKGFSWDNKNQKYKASINYNKQEEFLGRHETKEEARAAYIKAKQKHSRRKENSNCR